MERKRTITELKTLFSGLKGKPITDQMMRELINAMYPSDVNITSLAAEKVIPDTTNFNGLFSTISEYNNLQKILDKLDDNVLDSRYYTETEINNLLSGYSSTSHGHTFDSLSGKPNSLSGYGIADAYDKATINAMFINYEEVVDYGTTNEYYRGDKTWQTLNTAAVAEHGSYLYFTPGRARAAITENITGITYNSILGRFSLDTGYVIPLQEDINKGLTAYSWGNHATLYEPANANIQSHIGSTHQTIISGTGFVKANGTTLSYDNSTYLPLSGGTMSNNNLVSNLNSDLLDSFHLSEIVAYSSNRDFVNGTLITTNIDYSVSYGDAFYLKIYGNSYSGQPPFDLSVQGYIYYDTIVNVSGKQHGYPITGLVAINYNGNLCFWFPRFGYWQGFRVECYNVTSGTPQKNRVVSITDVAKPTTNKEVNISQSVYTGYGSDNLRSNSENDSRYVLSQYNSSLNSDSRNSRGVTRLYRMDSDSDYSVQVSYNSPYWHLRGYQGDTFYSEVRVGYSDVSESTNTIKVIDNRGADRQPSYYSQGINAFFTESIPASGGHWTSAITVRGWGDPSYNSWQLIGGSTSASFGKWWFREGISSFGAAYEIWHSGNFTPANYYLASNPSGYISAITSGMVTTALGYTPANAAMFAINSPSSGQILRYGTTNKWENYTHSFISASDVTYANLNTNGSVGTGANQVAVGNHTHSYLPLSGGTMSNTYLVTNLNAQYLNSIQSSQVIYGAANNGSNASLSTYDLYHLTQYKSGFWDVVGASWMPDGGYWWAITTAHSSNHSGYSYSGQIAISQYNDIVFRSVNNSVPANPSWKTIYHSGNLTNGLNSGKLTYWNGTKLADSTISVESGYTILGGSGTRIDGGLYGQNSQVLPLNDIYYDFGSQSKRWRNLYSEKLYTDKVYSNGYLSLRKTEDDYSGNPWFGLAYNGSGGSTFLTGYYGLTFKTGWNTVNLDGGGFVYNGNQIYHQGNSNLSNINWISAVNTSSESISNKYTLTAKSGSFWNPSLDNMTYFGGEPLTGTGTRMDYTAFKTELTVEKRVYGGGWESTPMLPNCHKGHHNRRFVEYYMSDSYDAIRFTWLWNGASLLNMDSILAGGSSNGNQLYITVEKSSDNSNWTNLYGEAAFGSSWPGYHFIQAPMSTDWTNPLYLRVTIRSGRTSPGQGFYIGSISVYGNYGWVSPLYSWDFYKKVTFANDIYVNNSKVYHEGNLSPVSVSGSADANYLTKFTGSGYAVSKSQVYDNGTNVAIGGTTAYFKLDVNGAIGLNDNKIHFRTNDPWHSLGYDGTTNGPFMYGYAGTALGYTNGSSATRTLYTYLDKVFIPSITFSTNRLIVMTPANGFSTIADGAAGKFLKTDGNGTYTWDTAGSSQWTNDTNGIYYSNSVGIGGSSSATYKLNVTGSVYSSTNITAAYNVVGDTLQATSYLKLFEVSSQTTYSSSALYLYAKTDHKLYYRNPSNVEMLLNPLSSDANGLYYNGNLSLHSSGYSGAKLYVNNSNQSSGVYIYDSYGYGLSIYSSANSKRGLSVEYTGTSGYGINVTATNTGAYGIYSSARESAFIGYSTNSNAAYFSTSAISAGVIGIATASSGNTEGGRFYAYESTTGIGAYCKGGRFDVAAAHSGKIAMVDGGSVFSHIYASSGTLYISYNGGTGVIVGNQTSDFWLKKDFRKLETPLEKILQVNGYAFNWKPQPSPFAPKDAIAIMLSNDTGKRDASGVIAQELEKLIPEAVNTNSDGYKSVNFNQVVPYLIEAMKELNNKIETLESKLSKYE